jgi:hypothetical protein
MQVHGRRALDVIRLFAPVGMDVAFEYAAGARWKSKKESSPSQGLNFFSSSCCP